jgi:hypothetical protein
VACDLKKKSSLPGAQHQDLEACFAMLDVFKIGDRAEKLTFYPETLRAR